MKTHHACKGTYGAVASLYKATWDTSSSSRYCPWAISPSAPDSVQWSTGRNIRENSASEIDATILLNSMGNDSARVPPFHPLSGNFWELQQQLWPRPLQMDLTQTLPAGPRAVQPGRIRRLKAWPTPSFPHSIRGRGDAKKKKKKRARLSDTRQTFQHQSEAYTPFP